MYKRQDIVGSGIDLLLQVIHFLEAVLSFRVSFGETGYPNPEFFKGCPQVAIEIPNEGNEVGAIVKCVPRPIIGRISLGKVSAKGEDSWNPRPSITGRISSISARLWLTQVRWGIAGMVVSSKILSTSLWVLSRVEPPAP